MQPIKNAAPRLVLTGYDDQSGRMMPAVTEQLPQHLPLIFTYASKGPTEPQVVTGKSLVDTYGDDTLDYRSPFATHGTVLLNAMNENANVVMLQRLQPADSKTATLRFFLDVLETQVPLYERDTDGYYRLDVNGSRIETGEMVPGVIAKWVIEEITGAVGTATPKAGTLDDGVNQSQMFPMWDIPADSFGSRGNLTGVRIYAPSTQGLEPIDESLALEQKAYIYRFQAVTRRDARSTPVIYKTLFGEPFVEFALNPEAINTRFDTELFVDKVIGKAYRDMSPGDSGVPKYGPFDTMYLYHNYIQQVSQLVYTNEQAATGNTLPEGDGAEYIINLLSGKGLNGAHYHSMMLHGILDGGIDFTENSTHYLRGGLDGTMGHAAYNADVAHQLSNFGDLDVPYEDMARYPFSVFYDTGFDLATKRLIPRILGVRKDVSVALATQDILLPRNTASQESSMAIALRTALRVFPESTVFGTPCCRGVVVGHSGELVFGPYTGQVPGTIELAIKRARYMGAANGVFVGRNSYDEPPNNHLNFLKNINVTWKPQEVRNRDWDNGLIWAQYFDRHTLFFPGIQTVYDDSTSVLNSDINMLITTYLSKVCFFTWRMLTGNSKLTNEQFIERSNELIEEYTRNRFDGRVVIVPETFYTEADETRGFSWSCRIHMYANNMKTVSVSTIVTHRLEDL